MTTLANWVPSEESYCLFCGAGFSKWAIDLPTAYELFDFKIKTFGIRENAKLKKIEVFKKEWDKKNPTGNAEEFIAYLIDQSIASKKLVIWYIARRLAEPFIEKAEFAKYYTDEAVGRRVMAIDEKRKFERVGIKKAADFINHISGVYFEGIITTNYDLLIEYALGSKKFFYGDRPRLLYGPRRAYTIAGFKQTPVKLKGSIPVIKLHGSISLTDKGYCADGRGCINGKAIIVPPTHNKKISDYLILEWQYARKILKNSRKIIFFGFRFNDYDQELINLFKETAPWIQKILLINTNPETKSMAKQIWPSAEIVWIEPSELVTANLNSII